MLEVEGVVLYRSRGVGGVACCCPVYSSRQGRHVLLMFECRVVDVGDWDRWSGRETGRQTKGVEGPQGFKEVIEQGVQSPGRQLARMRRFDDRGMDSASQTLSGGGGVCGKKGQGSGWAGGEGGAGVRCAYCVCRMQLSG